MSDLKLRRMGVVDLARNWAGPMEAKSKPCAKRRLDIEALLRWAYLEELPKVPRLNAAPAGFRGAWDKVAQALEELSLAGLDDNRYGVVPDFSAQSLPHADALLVHEAVERLDLCALDLPADWSPLSDLGDIDGHAGNVAGDALAALTTVDRDGVRHLRRTPRRLVMRHALLGGCPDWQIDPPEVKFVSEFGKAKWFVREVVTVEGPCGPVPTEIEVDGFDHKRRIPKPDAYRKTFLEPDPTAGCVGRGEYEVWRAALDVLFEDLRGMLTDIEVMRCPRPWRPWEEPADAPARVLPDLMARESAPVRRRRKKIARNA